MAALFLEQEFTDRPELLNIILGDPSSDVDRAGDRSQFLHLGDLEAIPNLIDHESLERDLLLHMKKCEADSDGAVAEGGNEDGNTIPRGGFENGLFIRDVAPQNLQISPRGDGLFLQLVRNPGEKVNDPIDFVVIHQSIIYSDDTVFPQGIVIAFLGPDIMPVSESFKKIVKYVRPGRDDDVDQFHLNHVPDHSPHPAGDHCPRQPQKDDASGIIEHLPKNVKTFENISTLKGRILEALDQIQQALCPLDVQMLNGVV